MKNMKNMLSQIMDLPLYKKIHYIKNIELFKEKMPKHLAKHILNIKQKESKLHIITSHPAIATELKHKKDEIYFILKLLQEHKKIFLDVQEINIFATYEKKPIKNISKKKKYKQKDNYDEKSYATFINYFDDMELYNKLENIRNIIKIG